MSTIGAAFHVQRYFVKSFWDLLTQMPKGEAGVHHARDAIPPASEYHF